MRASPSPSPTSAATSVVARLRGKLAISQGSPGSGGWIFFPGGGYAPDPSSNVSIKELRGGYWGLTYVPALNRWLPVPPTLVSPDGTRYAYLDDQSPVIDVVSTDGGTRSALSLPIRSGPCNSCWDTVSVQSSGVYLTPSYFASPESTGLWLVPYSGLPIQVTADGHWSAADADHAYGFLNSRSSRGAAETIVRVDLSSGVIEDVFRQPGMLAAVAGIGPDGQAVIQAFDDVEHPAIWQIWIAQPGAAKMIYQGPGTVPAGAYGYSGVSSVVPDLMGTWIATVKGLYLYSSEAGFELASPLTGQLASALVS